MPYAIRHERTGWPPRIRAIEAGWAHLADEVAEVELRPDDMVTAEDGVSLRAETQADLDARALYYAKDAKIAELKAAFEKSAKRSIDVDGVLYSGGLLSALKVDGVTRVGRGRGKGQGQGMVKVRPHGQWDKIEISVEQAEEISFKISERYELDDDAMGALCKQVEAAPDIVAVEAVTPPPEWTT